MSLPRKRKLMLGLKNPGSAAVRGVKRPATLGNLETAMNGVLQQLDSDDPESVQPTLIVDAIRIAFEGISQLLEATQPVPGLVDALEGYESTTGELKETLQQCTAVYEDVKGVQRAVSTLPSAEHVSALEGRLAEVDSAVDDCADATEFKELKEEIWYLTNRVERLEEEKRR